MATILSDRNVCTECGGTQFIVDHETGELVCRSCGYVISSTTLDRSPEWRAFSQEQRESLPRVGAPITWTIHDKGLSTMISWQDRDAAGRMLDPSEKAKLHRLRTLHRRSRVSKGNDRNLAQALNEIKRVSYLLNLPQNAMETSSLLYRRAGEMNLIRGRPIGNMAVAALYMACRQCNVLRTIDEVAEAADLTRKDVAANYRLLLTALKTPVPPSDTEGYIGKMVNKLSLAGETESLAKVILYKAAELKFTIGRGPSGIAAACVYISCLITGEKRTQGQIARVAQVTEVTVRNRYKELTKHLSFNIGL